MAPSLPMFRVSTSMTCVIYNSCTVDYTSHHFRFSTFSHHIRPSTRIIPPKSHPTNMLHIEIDTFPRAGAATPNIPQLLRGIESASQTSKAQSQQLIYKIANGKYIPLPRIMNPLTNPCSGYCTLGSFLPRTYYTEYRHRSAPHTIY